MTDYALEPRLQLAIDNCQNMLRLRAAGMPHAAAAVEAHVRLYRAGLYAGALGALTGLLEAPGPDARAEYIVDSMLFLEKIIEELVNVAEGGLHELH